MYCIFKTVTVIANTHPIYVFRLLMFGTIQVQVQNMYLLSNHYNKVHICSI